MKAKHFLCIDDSNDGGLLKMHLIGVCLFVHRFLDMGCTSGVQAISAAVVLDKIDTVVV